MAGTHASGFRSGKDFERNVYMKLGGSSQQTGGVLTTRDSSVDPTDVQQAINDALRAVVMRAVEGSQFGGVQRLTRTHDFTYPVNAEFVALDPESQPEGTLCIDPALPTAYFDIRKVEDRSRTYTQPDLEFVRHDRLTDTGGLRASFEAGRLFVTDRSWRRGPSRSLDLRLYYVPALDPIDVGNEDMRRDIPLELHPLIELCAAHQLALDAHSDEAPGLEARYEKAAQRALESFGHALSQPQFARNTRFAKR